MPFSRKRVAFTKILNGTGIIRLIEAFPTRAGLLVLTYHRLGNKPDCDFDRGVISASADQFDQQIAFLKRRFPIVDFEEALRLLRNPTGMKHYYVLLSFDDGYLDNYEAALPVLRAHGCSAIFFVVPQLVGTATLPWWDEIAFLVRSCRRSTLEISPYKLELARPRTGHRGTVTAFQVHRQSRARYFFGTAQGAGKYSNTYPAPEVHELGRDLRAR